MEVTADTIHVKERLDNTYASKFDKNPTPGSLTKLLHCIACSIGFSKFCNK